MPYMVPKLKRMFYDSRKFEELLDIRNRLAWETYVHSGPSRDRDSISQREAVEISSFLGYAGEDVTPESVMEDLREDVLRELVNELIYVDRKLFPRMFRRSRNGRLYQSRSDILKNYPWLRKSP